MTSNQERVGLDALHERLHRVLPAVSLSCQALPKTPQIRLWLLDELFPEQALDPQIVNAIMEAPPYWSFCWASGQVLAEFLLANPQWVQGRCIVDVGPGSGVVAIAAAMAGASRVIACDLDQDALTATALNAAENRVNLELSQEVPDLNPPGYRLLGQWQSCTWPDLGESSEYNGVRVFASEPSP